MPGNSKKSMWEKIWIKLSTSFWTPLILAVVVLGLLILIQFLKESQHKPSISESKPNSERDIHLSAIRDSAFAAVRKVMSECRISCRVLRPVPGREEIWAAKVPADVPLPSVHLSLQEAVSNAGAGVLSAETDPATGRTVLQIGIKDSCFFKIQLTPSNQAETAAGNIALIIDDFGDRLDNLVFAFFDLDGKITISVLPGRKLSGKVAREANARGCEVILHLAMEPMQAAFREDGYTIMTKMPRADIHAAFQRALDQVPSAVGVNNHMGSRATSDRQTMMDVLEGIKQRGLFFMDSYTVASSVAYEVAMEMGIPSAKRDVFLDVDGSEETIRQKLWECARKAKKNGISVGIGHCHQNMLGALQKEMPRIQEEGLRFVPLSEVVK